jgi:hypothetical protein
MKPSDLPPLSEEARELLEMARRTNGPPIEVKGRMLYRLKSAVGLPLTPGDATSPTPVDPAGATGATGASAGAGGAGAAAGTSLASLFKPAVLIALGATGLAAVVTTAVVVSRSPQSPTPTVERAKDESFAPATIPPRQRGITAQDQDESAPTPVPPSAPGQDHAAPADDKEAPEIKQPTRSKQIRIKRQRARRSRRIKRQRARRAWIKRQRAKQAKIAMSPAPQQTDPMEQPEPAPTEQPEPAPTEQPEASKPEKEPEIPTPPPVKPRPPSTLKAERALIEPARRALKKNKPRRALRLVEKHRRLYADGQLSEERELIAIRALALLGKKEQARAAAQRFLRRYPKSLLRPLVEAILRKQH